MRGNIRGSSTLPTTVAAPLASSSSLLVLIGGLRLAQHWWAEKGRWIYYLPIYTILGSSITHVPLGLNLCLECSVSAQPQNWSTLPSGRSSVSRLSSETGTRVDETLQTKIRSHRIFLGLNTKYNCLLSRSTIPRLNQSDVVTLQHDPSQHLRIKTFKYWKKNSNWIVAANWGQNCFNNNRTFSVFLFRWTSQASSRTRFMYSSNPVGDDVIIYNIQLHFIQTLLIPCLT